MPPPMTMIRFRPSALLVFILFSLCAPTYANDADAAAKAPAHREAISSASNSSSSSTAAAAHTSEAEEGDPATTLPIIPITPRIVGGQPAPPRRYPYTVALLTYSSQFVCGGSLIAPDVVLSAAHCLNAVQYGGSVEIGRYDRGDSSDAGVEEFTITSAVPHPNYDSLGTTDHDVMLLKLNGVSTYQPVKLNSDATMLSSGMRLTVMGWGVMDPNVGIASDVLREVDVKYVPNDVCAAESYGTLISDDMMCASDAGKDSCQGDSGGPLVLRGDSSSLGSGSSGGGEDDLTELIKSDVQVGIVSWGYGCAQPGYPGVYSRIDYLFDWIETNANELSDEGGIIVGTDAPTVSASPTMSRRPSAMPSSSSAPSVMRTPITLVIQLDTFPSEVGWSIASIDASEVHHSRPSGTYDNMASQLVVETVMLYPDYYNFVITDVFGDGICCSFGQGYVSLYVGRPSEDDNDDYDPEDDPNLSLIWTQQGNYGSGTVREFYAGSPPTNSPTVSSAPSVSLVPSVAPTVSSAPSMPKVPITLVIGVDEYPNEIKWEVVDAIDGDVFGSAQFGTYYDVSPGGTIVEAMDLVSGDEYLLKLYDSWGDGICCFSGEGYYALYFGRDTTNDGMLIVAGQGDYGMGITVPFVAAVPPTASPTVSPLPTISMLPTTSPSSAPIEPPTLEPTPVPSMSPTSSNAPTVDFYTVTVVIQLDMWPSETGWRIYSLKGSNSDCHYTEECIDLYVEHPVWSYSGQEEYSLIEEVVALSHTGGEYYFEMTDSYGDGLDAGNGGYYRVYKGTGTIESELLFSGSGDFGHSVRHKFVVDDSFSRITMAPTASPAPSATKFQLTVLLNFDLFPSEISWSISAGNVTYASVPVGTYGDDQAYETVQETVLLDVGMDYVFSIMDSSGNGFCCNDGEGYYQLYAGRDTSDGGALILSEPADFADERRHTFFAGDSPTWSPTISLIPTASIVPTIGVSEEDPNPLITPPTSAACFIAFDFLRFPLLLAGLSLLYSMAQFCA